MNDIGTIQIVGNEFSTIKPVLRVKKLHPDAILPKYATEGAACFDLHAIVQADPARMIVPDADGSITVRGGSAEIFRTGLSFEVPPGWAMMIYSRSGHGFNSNVRLSNCVGVIDSDYRGEVMVKLRADSELCSLKVKHGDRIAQAMLVPAQQWELVEAGDLTDTARGTGGFGSTGQGV